MIPQSWTPLRYHEAQHRAWRSKKRFINLAAGRGSGKTELARRRIVLSLTVKKPWPNPIYIFALPTYSQAEKVAWKEINNLIPPSWINKRLENKLYIETVFGSALYVVGMDRPERIEGLQIDGAVIDESCDQRPGVFSYSISPMLEHRNAWCWRIGVPKRYGVGAADFKEFFDRGVQDDPEIDSFSWSSRTVLNEEQIRSLESRMDEKAISELIDANWEDVGGLIFYAFSQKDNISSEAAYIDSLPIVVGSDFNVNPMAWVLAHRVGDELHVFDELFLRNTNTQATLDVLYNKYNSHRAGWEFFGDAAGRQRKTSASRSDYLIIKNDKRFAGSSVHYPQSNPRILDRFAACNNLFYNRLHGRRLLINPRCKNLIRDCKVRAYKEGTMEPDDDGDIGHITDALGYAVIRLFPMKITMPKAPSVVLVK